MKRSRLRSRPKPSTTDRELAHLWWIAVARGKKCVVCGTKRSVEGHHLVPQSVLAREYPHGVVLEDGRWQRCGTYDLRQFTGGGDYRSLEQLRWSAANGLAVCTTDHQRHELAVARIPLHKIPAEAWAFATELGLEHRLAQRYYAAV